MTSKATTVEQYLSELPPERRAVLEAVRAEIRQNLDPDYEEGIQYGMIGYYIPHRIHPAGYHCDPRQPVPYLGLAAQKNHFSLCLMPIYASPELLAWFQAEWAKTGKKLDMGKACVRFKKLEDLPLAVIGKAVQKTPVKKTLPLLTTR
jgi:hypothetical protein